MTYSGLLIKESLQDLGILADLRIVKEEKWDTVGWSAVYFEVGEDEVDQVVRKFSEVLKSKGWYLNMNGDEMVYVIFPGKVFKYRRGDATARAEAVEYGKTIDIPQSQLDWKE